MDCHNSLFQLGKASDQGKTRGLLVEVTHKHGSDSYILKKSVLAEQNPVTLRQWKDLNLLPTSRMLWASKTSLYRMSYTGIEIKISYQRIAVICNPCKLASTIFPDGFCVWAISQLNIFCILLNECQ